MKKLIVILLSIIVLSCAKKTKKTTSYIDYIPSDTQIVVKINDLEQVKNLLRDHDFLKKNNKLAFFSYFNEIPVVQKTQYSSGLLCFSPIGKNDYEYTYISKFDPTLIKKDTLASNTIETITYTTKDIYKIGNDQHTFYATQLDSILIASSSQILVENAIRSQDSKIATSSDLIKAYTIADQKKPLSLLIDGKKLRKIHNSFSPNKDQKGLANFSGWISVDASIKQNSIALDGIAIEKDSLSTTIGVFDNTIPQENRIASITPVTANGFISYTYDDFDILKNNLALAQDREIIPSADPLDELLSSISEIGMIYMEKENLFTFTCIDPENTLELLGGTPSGTYRNISIYAYNEPTAFTATLTPLFAEFDANYYFLYEDFIVFGASKDILQVAIANIQNKTLLGNQDYYANTLQKLSDESSILMVSSIKNLKEYIATNTLEPYQKGWNEINDTGYPITALQVIKEDNFAHIHTVFEKNIAKGAATSVHQIASTTLENKILTKPILVKNHRTKGMDIAVQDVDNNLYLISDKGTIFWKKQINGAIMGAIQQIDIYKNGRYQLVFNTETTLYLLDRDGNDVASYPKNFEKPITQPLSLFDYDKNKRYRIVITQGNILQMLDAEGKTVTGFGFKNTDTNLVLPPKHIRIGSKDYILISEENGKLTILDRLGRIRVHVKDKINSSTNSWYQYQNKFTSITKEGNLIQVQSDGSISYKNQIHEDNSKLVATNKTLVTFTENKLTIKDKTIELEYGVYTSPQLFYIDNKIYITITDIQSKKVYLYDSNAELFPNFPVYGNSAISLGNMDKDPNLEFAVQGDENGVLIYQIN